MERIAVKSNTKDNRKKEKFQLWIKSYITNWNLVVMLIPGLLAFTLFSYLPMQGIVIAFKDYKVFDGIWGSEWIGFKNFADMFAGDDFLRALKNTFEISFLKILFAFPMPILFAIILNECTFNRYKRIIQTFSYLPHFFSWIALSGIMTQVFSTSGAVNMLLSVFGVKEPVLFFADGFWFRFMIIITDIWKEFGWSSIIYLAAIMGIDPSLYEAAKIDGAGRLKQAIHITIPGIIPTIVTMFILRLSSVLNVGLDQIYSMYNPMVYDVSDILDTYVLRILQAADYSFGTAVGLFKSVVNLIFVVAGNFVVRKLTHGEQGIF